MTFDSQPRVSVKARQNELAPYARAGFSSLTSAKQELGLLAQKVDRSPEQLLEAFTLAADPDSALSAIWNIHERHPSLLKSLEQVSWNHLLLLVGASPALGDFFERNPETLSSTLRESGQLFSVAEARHKLLGAVAATPHSIDSADEEEQQLTSTPQLFAHSRYAGEAGAQALRVRYRELLAQAMLYDLIEGQQPDGSVRVFEAIAQSLTALADAALEAALAVARTTLETTGGQGLPVARKDILATRFAVVAMGKCGAEELNVVSDVDVIFIGESYDPDENQDQTLKITTRLASEMMRAIHDPAFEPALWEVDPNLRPEGRNGPLVRTLRSHLNYYDRWAQTWEFQALMKARPVAGDQELGLKYVQQTQPYVWASASRDDFVGSVQRMRERVTEHIIVDDPDVQLKLGPGGLRDVEFSVQLLQLVHGQQDETLRLRGTLDALDALVRGGYVARADGERLGRAYRVLRVLEHRLQLRDLRRTATMPTDDDELRVLARASHLASDGKKLRERWQSVRREVRELHLKIFYAPLLSAVAALPDEELVLGSEEARVRLSTIGFKDPDGAMRHLTALTRGTGRRAQIQRNLMPVLLHWFGQGTDPDYGLLAFRRISEKIHEASWYLRLLRDGTDAAERLTRVLSTSRFAGELLESTPEAVAWLEYDDQLVPTSLERIRGEMRALLSRGPSLQQAASRFRAIHRREVMRLALGAIVGINSTESVALGLEAAHTALVDGLLGAIRSEHEEPEGFELALIGMGRYGGGEMGFASDVDMLAVYRATTEDTEAAQRTIEIIATLKALVEDPRFSMDLDFDLRPEGKTGPLARSLDSYRSYYQRWSLTWEAQALLRARFVAGEQTLGDDFDAFSDEIRFPVMFAEKELREVRLVKARVEAERLPHGVDPKRHLKLGPGGLTDVEWLIQLLQLQHGRELPELRTVSTIGALYAAVEHGLLPESDADLLETSWRLASEIRSANKLWSGRILDVLPSDRTDLEGIARLLGYSPGHTTELEEHWFSAARKARAVFETHFFGIG